MTRAAFTAGPVRARAPGPDRPRAAPDGCRHHRRGRAGAAAGRCRRVMPTRSRTAVRKVRDTLDPDAADAAYLRALERRDITVTQVGEGFDIRGFLDPQTGAAFKPSCTPTPAKPASMTTGRPGTAASTPSATSAIAWLAARPAHRPRPPPPPVRHRRRRPAQLRHQRRPPAGEPAVLHGFGEISDQLLGQLACDCTITPVTIDPANGHVLDVGRTQRLATLKQRQAIFVQQAGICFNPGCDRTRLEIHHMIPWSHRRTHRHGTTCVATAPAATT